jgi:hypothetical protein
VLLWGTAVAELVRAARRATGYGSFAAVQGAAAVAGRHGRGAVLDALVAAVAPLTASQLNPTMPRTSQSEPFRRLPGEGALMTPLLVGLDVGTTSSKAVVFDVDGVACSEGSAPSPWVSTPDGFQMARDDAGGEIA